jgi:CRP-like cAMP-binding protein
MMPTRILRFHPDTISELTRRDLDVANMIAEDLLDLAAAESRGGAPLVAHVSQQALADGIGCVREVVVRLLRELREEGLIRTGRDEIELLQPDRLHGETFPRDD